MLLDFWWSTTTIRIARAIYNDQPIILDEIQMHDVQTEYKLLTNLVNDKSKTIIMIPHKPNTLKVCNKI